MGKIYITRHGETEWNTVRRMQGQCDSPLTELGKKQALWLENRLVDTKIDRIYSSSLGRALDTANIIKGSRNIEIIPSDALKEIFLGSWQGCLIEDVEKNYPEQHRCFWKEPGSYIPVDGETFEDLSKRVGEFFETLIKQHEKDDLLIVAHAIVLKALLNHILYEGQITRLWEGPPLRPTSLTILNYEAGKFDIELFADTLHYQEINPNGWFAKED